MDFQTKRRIEIPVYVFCILWALTALGWMIVAFLFGRIIPNDIGNVVSRLGITIFSAIFIGFSVSVILNFYMKNIFGGTLDSKLQEIGVSKVYESRKNCSVDFLKSITHTRNITIMGISNRDFLLGSGSIREVWNSIVDRLEKESNTAELKNENRLKVRVLLLDPKSSEGRFRHNVEKATIGKTGLPFDVPHGLEEINRVITNIYGDQKQEYLQARLYEHCPFSFIFATDSEAFIEQYYYRDHTKRVNLPVIQYSKNSLQYGEIKNSLKEIWNHATTKNFSEHHVGVSEAIEESDICNIYIRDKRNFLGRRQHECVFEAPPGSIIKILSISGRFYTTHPMLEALRKISTNGKERGKVQFALINPVSSQAILRAVADSYPPEKISQCLGCWTWEKHNESALYSDVHQTIRELNRWKENGCNFEIHLYSCSISCALLITPSSIFIEQYMYGRSRVFQEGHVLGGEYPVFEFAMPKDDETEQIEQEMLLSSFKVIWDSYSIELNKYDQKNEEDVFHKNLESLYRQIYIQSDDVNGNSCKMQKKEAELIQ